MKEIIFLRSLSSKWITIFSFSKVCFQFLNRKLSKWIVLPPISNKRTKFSPTILLNFTNKNYFTNYIPVYICEFGIIFECLKEHTATFQMFPRSFLRGCCYYNLLYFKLFDLHFTCSKIFNSLCPFPFYLAIQN